MSAQKKIEEINQKGKQIRAAIERFKISACADGYQNDQPDDSDDESPIHSKNSKSEYEKNRIKQKKHTKAYLRKKGFSIKRNDQYLSLE